MTQMGAWPNMYFLLLDENVNKSARANIVSQWDAATGIKNESDVIIFSGRLLLIIDSGFIAT